MSKFEPKNYYITAAQAYGELNHDFLKSSETFVKDKKAEFIVLPMNGRTQAESRLDILDTLPQLKDHLLFKAETLNEHIGISDIKVPPQNVDPSTGRGRFIAKDKTLIVPHAKQRFRAFPNSNYDLPKIFLTPGAITFPNYNRENNKGDVAARDHAYGAIYVEIVNDKIFHFIVKKLFLSNNISITPTFYENGLEALNKIKENLNSADKLPDLILLDINMPVLDGWQFLEEYKELKEKLPQDILIYIVSSSDNPYDRSKAKDFNEEIKDYWLKPLSGDLLKTLFAS